MFENKVVEPSQRDHLAGPRRWIHVALTWWLLGCLAAATVVLSAASASSTPRAPSPTQSTIVRCEPSAVQATVGEEFTVDLYVEDVENLYAVDLETDFDVGFLQVIDADGGTEGIQLQPVNGWFWSDWIWNNEADNGTGHTHYLATQQRTFHPDPVDGSGPIARITFTGLQGGTTVVTWSRADLTTPDGVAISNVAQDCTVTLVYHYDVGLAPGWNLVSWPLVPATENLTDTLDDLGDICDEAWAYDAWDGSDPWKEWPGDLVQADEATGLWLHATEAAILTVTGWLPDSPSIELRAGWNLVGYPSHTARPVDEALASIDGYYTTVETFDPTDPVNPWKDFDVDVPSYANDLVLMEPGKGYWIYVTSDCTWEVPE